MNWAHPRSRGEHEMMRRLNRPDTGSSPLARGTQHEAEKDYVINWLIPARAGNTKGRRSRIEGRGAHPRSRGEHLRSPTWKTTTPGSSPLARGTQDASTGGRKRYGLIPARAGNT